MIAKDNLLKFLEGLGFTERKGVFSKTLGTAGLSVDTVKEAVVFPEAQGLIINERQTCNVSANENFVVFECVHATKVRNIKVIVPPLAEQKRLVAKVEKLEKQIAEARAIIASAPARKQAIMQRYL